MPGGIFMPSRFFKVFCLLLIVTLFIAGCGKKEEADTAPLVKVQKISTDSNAVNADWFIVFFFITDRVF